jgi:threonine dehydratase
MPSNASVSKAAAVRAFGGTVVLDGASVEDCVAAAREAAERGLAFVHPFDDPAIVAGQAGVGLEVVDQVDDVATVVVPIGGGGLASGVALAVKQLRPGVRVVGVRAERYPATIADGIAVKSPVGLTRELVDEWVDDVVTVPDDAIADAMVLLLERSKLVVEGAGAAALAALLAGRVEPAGSGTTVAILSGGNVDPGVLASIVRRSETGAGRRVRVMTLVPDWRSCSAWWPTRAAT